MFGNILNTALRAIPKQTVTYFPFRAKTTNEWGKDVVEYETPIELQGSLQAVSIDKMQYLGLESSKQYVMFYSTQRIGGIERDTSGDQLSYNGTRYQVLNKNDWMSQDGWSGVLCVRVYD